MDLNAWLLKFGISESLRQDIILVLLLAAVGFIFGIFVGRFRLVTVLINIYVALALLSAVPESYLSDYLYEIGFFIGAVIALTLFSKRLFEIHISGSGSYSLARIFAMSFIEVIMLASIVLSLMPKKIALDYVSQNAYQYLASSEARFIWLVIPLIFISIIHKKLNR